MALPLTLAMEMEHKSFLSGKAENVRQKNNPRKPFDNSGGCLH